MTDTQYYTQQRTADIDPLELSALLHCIEAPLADRPRHLLTFQGCARQASDHVYSLPALRKLLEAVTPDACFVDDRGRLDVMLHLRRLKPLKGPYVLHVINRHSGQHVLVIPLKEEDTTLWLANFSEAMYPLPPRSAQY